MLYIRLDLNDRFSIEKIHYSKMKVIIQPLQTVKRERSYRNAVYCIRINK